jgi:hypothetical protein
MTADRQARATDLRRRGPRSGQTPGPPEPNRRHPPTARSISTTTPQQTPTSERAPPHDSDHEPTAAGTPPHHVEPRSSPPGAPSPPPCKRPKQHTRHQRNLCCPPEPLRNPNERNDHGQRHHQPDQPPPHREQPHRSHLIPRVQLTKQVNLLSETQHLPPRRTTRHERLDETLDPFPEGTFRTVTPIDVSPAPTTGLMGFTSGSETCDQVEEPHLSENSDEPHRVERDATDDGVDELWESKASKVGQLRCVKTPR